MASTTLRATITVVVSLTFSVAAWAADLAWVPVAANGPHSISGNRVVLPRGDMRVTLELRLSNWGSDLSASTKLMYYQARLDTTDFVSGSQGALTHAAVPCATDADCFGDITCGTDVPGICDVTQTGMQASTFIDVEHPDFVFPGVPMNIGMVAVTPDYVFGAMVQDPSDSAADDGLGRYLATMMLDVSPDAVGTFTIGLNEDDMETFLGASTQQIIPILMVPAEIVIDPLGVDCNGNGINDLEDIAGGTSADCNANDIPDECEPDCNGNGDPDDCDVTGGGSADCNDNVVPDECESDCNANGSPDDCDITAGTSQDCDESGVPDECEEDCNGNGRNDLCDLANGTSEDCDGNGVPDECPHHEHRDCNENGLVDSCELADAVSSDCNANGVPDTCDVAQGDCNENGVPDTCDPDCNGNGIPDDCDTDGCQSGFALVPINATPGFYKPSLDEIIVPVGATVRIEGQVFGWGPQLLQYYQFEVDGSWFTSGDGAALALAKIPCSTDADCDGALRCGWNEPGYCEIASVYNAAVYIDASRPDFVFASAPDAITGVRAYMTTSPPYQVLGGTAGNAVDSASDSGFRKYAGTILVAVPDGASGTYVFSIDTTDESSTFLVDEQMALIALEAVRPGRITVLDDCNGNSTPDGTDIAAGTSEDCDANGFPDECDLVLRPNGDANGNLILDVCELFVDCNGNGVSDRDDISGRTSTDCNLNGIPDECEPDCNGNGAPDDCDLNQGCSLDCDGNGVPDDCEEDCNRNGVRDDCDLAGGTSFDCDADGVPDECSPFGITDCDGNGVPDACDIAAGTTEDCDANGVPDACEIAAGGTDCDGNGIVDACDPDCDGDGVPNACDSPCVAGLALVPVGARPSYHRVSAYEIIVQPGATVELSGRVFGWGPERLQYYQFEVDGASYGSGEGDALVPAKMPCSADSDCPNDLRCGWLEPGFCEYTGLKQPSVFVDRARPDFVFVDLPGAITGAYSSAGNPPQQVLGATAGIAEDSVADTGTPRYAGTLLYDVPVGARGTYVFSILPDNGTQTFMVDGRTSVIPVESRIDARITVIDDCNSNGVSDTDDLASGTSEDCNLNGFPDECDVVLDADADSNGDGIPDDCGLVGTIASAAGGRYLAIAPIDADGISVALHVTSPDVPCLDGYVRKSGDGATLSDSPTFLSPAAWGAVLVASDKIVPESAYEVVAERIDHVTSEPVMLRTAKFGDLIEPVGVVDFKDIAESVRAFRDQDCLDRKEHADLYPRIPDGVIDFRDIALVVSAFVGDPFPYPAPCH